MPFTDHSFTLRSFTASDESSWLRCRILSFMETCYFDDVRTTRPTSPTLQLVAVRDTTVAGILDIDVDGELATIDTIAVHPDHQRLGVASALLDAGLAALPRSVTALDAWTREDAAACSWYRRNSFEESDHYLHVYKGWQEPTTHWVAPEPLSPPVMAFCHASIENEAELRARFARVYVCRRFSRSLDPGARTVVA